MRIILSGLILLLVVVQAKRDVFQHLVNQGEFRSLISGDLSGFTRRTALNQETYGLSDRLGLDNLLGGSKTEGKAPFSLSGKLASGWHSKNAIQSLNSLEDSQRFRRSGRKGPQLSRVIRGRVSGNHRRAQDS